MGVQTAIATELLTVQQQFKANSDSSQHEEQTQDNISRADLSHVQSGTPIPGDLFAKLTSHGRKVLTRKNITTCEQVLAYKYTNLLAIPSTGIKTAQDIQRLQQRICYRYRLSMHVIGNKRLRSDPQKARDPFFYLHRLDCTQTDERKVTDPAEWSVLSRTLAEVFEIEQTLLCQPDTAAATDQLLVSSLPFLPRHIDILRGIAIFPDDPITVLFSVSLGYLLQANIDDALLFCILDYLAHASGYNDGTPLTISATVRDTPIFFDVPVSTISELRIAHPLQIESRETQTMPAQIMTWGEVAQLSERGIVRDYGFTTQTLKTIRHIWNLKLPALKQISQCSHELPIDSYCSFDQLIHDFINGVAMDEREWRILNARLGGVDGRKWTLDELGKIDGVSRERIRQIEHRRMRQLTSDQSINKLTRLWLALEEILSVKGGVCFARDVAVYLGEQWGWSSLPSAEAVASLVNLSSKFTVVGPSPLRLVSPGHPCVNCQQIRTTLLDAVGDTADGELSFEDAIRILHDFCTQRHCGISSGVPWFSNGFIHFIADAHEDIVANDTLPNAQDTWAIKYRKPKRSIVIEKILLDASRPMHLTEVCTAMNKDMPENMKFSVGNVYSFMNASPNLLFWGRGTYIHRNHVAIPVALLREIEIDIIDRLNGDIPFISVNGIFEQYAEKLTSLGVPNASALYSCLLESKHPALQYPRYPKVMQCGFDVNPISFPRLLESFILSHQRVVTWEELREYAVERLCMNELLLRMNYLSNIPNVLHVKRGKYIHLQYVGVEKDQLTPIIDHLTMLLGTFRHISVIKLYNEQREICRKLGITTPLLLFSLLHELYADQFDLSKYPSICLLGARASTKRSVNIVAEVRRYLLQKRTPCSVAELYEYFCESLGYEKTSIYRINFDFRVMRYNETMVVPLGVIEWTAEKQLALEAMAAKHLCDRQRAGIPFGLASIIYEDLCDQLPLLPEQIHWTSTLIRELLSRVGNYHIIGSQRNAFVIIPNENGIESLDDLLYHMLVTKYEGAANMKTFVTDMRNMGILERRLTSLMLGPESRVTIDGDVVRVSELHGKSR